MNALCKMCEISIKAMLDNLWVFATGILMMTGCAHAPQSCEVFCLSRGGSCSYIEKGTTRYNTSTGKEEETATHFNCERRW